jgi:hypothetical protein
MKLQSIGIANFKAFGNEIQSIPIRPITLVFGPNSAGKSSLLHSLLWLNHVFLTGDCDVTHPTASLGIVHLGGFKQIRHRHQTSVAIVYSLQFVCVPKLQTSKKSSEAIANTIEVKLAFAQKTWTNSDADFGLIMTRILFDGKTLLKSSGPTVSELDLAHPIFRECIQKFATDHNADVESILEFLSELIRRNVFEVKLVKGLPVALEYDFMELIMVCDDGSPVSYKQAGELIKEILLASIQAFDLFAEPARSSVIRLSYLPPVRDLPPRNFDPSERREEAWREIARNPALVEQLNDWLSCDRMLGTGYRLENRAFLPADSIQKRSPALLRHELWNLLKETNFSEDAAFFIREAEAEFRRMDPHVYMSNYPDFYESRIADAIECYGDDEIAGLSECEQTAWGKSVVDDMISNKNENDWLWDHFLSNYQPLIEYLNEKWNVNDAAKRLSCAIENECKDRKFELSLVQIGSETRLALQDVGFGISQFLPVLIHSFASKNQLIAIEQPEIHIHPRLQAELGDVFIESALGANKNTFLLETHSEHMILRILRRIRETTEGEMEGWPEALRNACPNGIRPEDVAVLYVKPGKDGAQVETLRINELGEFVDEWPGGFFDERIREIL